MQSAFACALVVLTRILLSFVPFPLRVSLGKSNAKLKNEKRKKKKRGKGARESFEEKTSVSVKRSKMLKSKVVFFLMEYFEMVKVKKLPLDLCPKCYFIVVCQWNFGCFVFIVS